MISTIITIYGITVLVSFVIILIFAKMHIQIYENRRWDGVDSASLFGFAMIPVLNILIAARCLWGIRQINKEEELWD